jgi:hypothetical protein
MLLVVRPLLPGGSTPVSGSVICPRVYPDGAACAREGVTARINFAEITSPMSRATLAMDREFSTTSRAAVSRNSGENSLFFLDTYTLPFRNEPYSGPQSGRLGAGQFPCGHGTASTGPRGAGDGP